MSCKFYRPREVRVHGAKISVSNFEQNQLTKAQDNRNAGRAYGLTRSRKFFLFRELSISRLLYSFKVLEL